MNMHPDEAFDIVHKLTSEPEHLGNVGVNLQERQALLRLCRLFIKAKEKVRAGASVAGRHMGRITHTKGFHPHEFRKGHRDEFELALRDMPDWLVGQVARIVGIRPEHFTPEPAPTWDDAIDTNREEWKRYWGNMTYQEAHDSLLAQGRDPAKLEMFRTTPGDMGALGAEAMREGINRAVADALVDNAYRAYHEEYQLDRLPPPLPEAFAGDSQHPTQPPPEEEKRIRLISEILVRVFGKEVQEKFKALEEGEAVKDEKLADVLEELEPLSIADLEDVILLLVQPDEPFPTHLTAPGSLHEAFDPNEARDEHGRWTGTGGDPGFSQYKKQEEFGTGSHKFKEDPNWSGAGKDSRAVPPEDQINLDDFDPYEVLGVGKNASQAELQAAFRRRLFTCHPDCGGNSKATQQVQKAYDYLKGGGKGRYRSGKSSGGGGGGSGAQPKYKGWAGGTTWEEEYARRKEYYERARGAGKSTWDADAPGAVEVIFGLITIGVWALVGYLWVRSVKNAIRDGKKLQAQRAAAKATRAAKAAEEKKSKGKKRKKATAEAFKPGTSFAFHRWTKPDLKEEHGEIRRHAKVLGIPHRDLHKAFQRARLVPLKHEHWKKLKNTDSWTVKSMGDVEKLANRYGRKTHTIAAAFRSKSPLPAPLVVVDHKGNYHLVAGNTRLMVAKAMGIRPHVYRADLRPNAVKEACGEYDAEYSCVMFRLNQALPNHQHPVDPLQLLREMQMRIPDGYLEAEQGREDDLHVTIEAGLHTEDPLDVGELVRGYGPVTFKLGKTAVFARDEYDVVQVPVTGARLRGLHALVRGNLDYTSEWQKYNPHVTLAYVAKGQGEHFAGWNDVEGMEITLDRLTFSSCSGDYTTVSLVNDRLNFGTDGHDYTSGPAEVSTVGPAVDNVWTRELTEAADYLQMNPGYGRLLEYYTGIVDIRDKNGHHRRMRFVNGKPAPLNGAELPLIPEHLFGDDFQSLLAHFSNSLEKVPMPHRVKAERHYAIVRALSNLPPNALRRIKDNLQDVRWFENTTDILDSVIGQYEGTPWERSVGVEQLKKYKEMPDVQVGGMYSFVDGTLNLVGRTSGSEMLPGEFWKRVSDPVEFERVYGFERAELMKLASEIHLPGTPEYDRMQEISERANRISRAYSMTTDHEIYTHELGHVVDMSPFGPNEREALLQGRAAPWGYSTSPEWMEACRAELIDGQGQPTLTQYALTGMEREVPLAREAFAEFFRLVQTANPVKLSEVKYRTHPRMSKCFIDWGFWPDFVGA
jgi:2'-5' RNA ligase